jgi:hypothetical protein
MPPDCYSPTLRGAHIVTDDEETAALFEVMRGMLAQADEEKAARAVEMPDDASALRVLHRAYRRLKETGWNDAQYARDGAWMEVIEVGSTGIHRARCDRELKCWWIADGGDLWPSRPVLCRPLPESGHNEHS